MDDKTTALAAEAIPPHLRPHADRIYRAGQRSLDAAWELGQALLLAREATKHGEWLPFLRVVGIAERSARRYIGVAVQLAERPDPDERNALTTIAVWDDPALVGSDDNPVDDWPALDARLARHLSGDEELAGLEDDERCEIDGQQYRTHPVLTTIPRMTDTLVESLAKSIAKIGQLDPVVVHPGTRTLIDGRGRLEACALAGVTVKWIELRANMSPSAAVWGYNVLRQSLTEEETARFVAKCKAVGSYLEARRKDPDVN